MNTEDKVTIAGLAIEAVVCGVIALKIFKFLGKKEDYEKTKKECKERAYEHANEITKKADEALKEMEEMDKDSKEKISYYKKKLEEYKKGE